MRDSNPCPLTCNAFLEVFLPLNFGIVDTKKRNVRLILDNCHGILHPSSHARCVGLRSVHPTWSLILMLLGRRSIYKAHPCRVGRVILLPKRGDPPGQVVPWSIGFPSFSTDLVQPHEWRLKSILGIFFRPFPKEGNQTYVPEHVRVGQKQQGWDPRLAVALLPVLRLRCVSIALCFGRISLETRRKEYGRWNVRGGAVDSMDGGDWRGGDGPTPTEGA